MKLAITFTNFGPYHLARLRALDEALARQGGTLIAYEMSSCEKKYPWSAGVERQSFARETFFPSVAVEDVSSSACARAMIDALDRDEPDAVAVVGYARPESMAALRWAIGRRRPAILLSESQEIDHPRAWWKEAVKRRRVCRFSSALVGGPRHRDYLVALGMDINRIALGYDAVDNEFYASQADRLRSVLVSRPPIATDYFLAVNRFVPEKNLIRLVHAFARYRADAPRGREWKLVLCGSGPQEGEVDDLVHHLGLRSAVYRPGFLEGNNLASWYAYAGAFVHPSRMEPWGLVVNEAAASGLPLIVSDRAGCVETLVPDSPPTGRRIDPDDVEGMASAMAWMAGLEREDRRILGRNARSVVADWGPDRFASGLIEALALADPRPAQRIREIAR